MATEFKLSYTGSEVNEKLGKIDGLVEAKERLTDELDIERDRVNKLIAFNSVAEMKQANLQSGDCVSTTGYYAANDGGAGRYIIYDTKHNGWNEQLDNGLYAQLLTDGTINLKQAGAYSGNDIGEVLNRIISETTIPAIYIPAGRYGIYTTVALSRNINIYGERFDNTTLGTYINSYCNEAFTTNSNGMQCNFESLRFQGGIHKDLISDSIPDFSILFSRCNFNGAVFRDVEARGYNIILNGGFYGCSLMDNCNFNQVKTAVFTNKLMPTGFEHFSNPSAEIGDAKINNCYFNGSTNHKSYFTYDVYLGTTTISNCYIDFFYAVVGIPQDAVGVARRKCTATFIGNTIEWFYRLFDNQDIWGAKFIGNNIRNSSTKTTVAASKLQRFLTYLTEEEIESGCIVFNSALAGVSTITGNHFTTMDCIYKFTEISKRLVIELNGYDDICGTIINCVYSGNSVKDSYVNMIDVLDYKVVNELPSALGANTYNGHKLYYNNALVMNMQGKWRYTDGKEVGAEEEIVFPVDSVNGKTGAVNLTASDVGADANGTAASVISAHNIDTNAHADIRVQISNLSSEIAKTDYILFADSLSELNSSGDKTKKYILPDGYIYEYKEVLSYTNLLPTALNRNNITKVLKGDDGSVGYLNKYHYSESSGLYQSSTEWDVSGLMPCVIGDVVRLKNITMNPNTEMTTTHGSVSFYSKYDGAYIGNINLIDISDSTSFNIELDDNGNIVKFTIPDWDGLVNGVYFSIVAQDINDDSVITVNEEILNTFVYAWTKSDYTMYSTKDIEKVDTLEEMTDDHESRLVALENNTSDVEIPDYWLTALQNGAEAINNALLNAGYNKSAFLFYSDAHWNYGSQMSPTLLKYLYQRTGMTKTFFGGDIVNNEADDYDTMAYLWDWRNQLKGLPNHHSVVGNHDDGNTTNNLFSEQYVYGYLLAAEETSDITRGDSGIYYYIDNPSEKTRYLCLDTAYQGVGNEQQEFVKSALLSTPSGWHIVAVAHIWHDTNYNVSPAVPSDINDGAAILLSMFDDYNSRSSEYENCSGWVEFCIGGHTHWDFDSTSDTGIPIILVEADGWAVRSGLDFTAGTTGEASVNGIIADYDKRMIHVIRIGRGESRDIEITEQTITYTNVISTSIDSTGAIFNDGKGWADTARIGSGVLDTYIGRGEYYITGHIEIDPTIDNVIRLRNITFKGDTTIDKIGIAFYDASFARVSMQGDNSGSNWLTPSTIANTENGFDVVYDGTNILQFTLKADSHTTNHSVQYIAICAEYIGDDSIITVNEEII